MGVAVGAGVSVGASVGCGVPVGALVGVGVDCGVGQHPAKRPTAAVPTLTRNFRREMPCGQLTTCADSSRSVLACEFPTGIFPPCMYS